MREFLDYLWMGLWMGIIGLAIFVFARAVVTLAGGYRKLFSLRNVIALLISLCFSVYAWITIAKSQYAGSALIGAMVAFVLGIQVTRLCFGAFRVFKRET